MKIRFESDPQIVITSYLGEWGSEMLATRIGYHNNQLKALDPHFRVAVVGSGYSHVAKKVFEANFPDVEFVWLKNKTTKIKKHQYILEWFYWTGRPQPLLLLDNDIIPHQVDGFEDPIPKLIDMLDGLYLPADHFAMYFSCYGMMADSFTRARLKLDDIKVAPLGVTGWAIMVSQGLDSSPNPAPLMNDEHQMSPDDMAWRVQLAAEGKMVLKHGKIFFKTFQSKSKYSESTLCDNHEQRQSEMNQTRLNLIRMYPWLWHTGNGTKGKQPIWTARGSVERALIKFGALIRTPYGNIVDPAKMQLYNKLREEAKHESSRKSLISMLKKGGDK